MRSIFLLLAVMLIALSTVNCGGGGGSQAVAILRQDPIEVDPGQQFTGSFGDVNVTIPAGAYPNGASLTLTQYTAAPFKPGNSNFKAMHPAIELSANREAQAEISLSVPSDPTGYVVGLENDDGSWKALRTTVVSGRLSFELPNTSTARPSSPGPLALWKLVIGIAKDNLPDTALGLHLVDGSGSFGDDSAIIIHGLLDNYASMKTMAKNMRSQYGWRNVYSLAYDWRMSGPDVAEYLGTILDDPSLSPKSVTLVGHSRGCIIIRYTLEKLDKTKPVKEAILFNGPHLGSSWATGVDIVSDIFTFWLNHLFAVSPIGLQISDPCVEELRTNSPFLADLNSYNFQQRGVVDYTVIAGDRDFIVPVGSGLAEGVELQELTGGNVLRFTMPDLNHFNIKNSPDQVNQFFALLGPKVDAFQIWAEPNPAAGQSDGWHYSVKVKNISSQSVTIDNLTFDQHRRDGAWYLTQWYLPVPGTFPDRYSYWGRVLQPGEVVEVSAWWRTNANNDPLSTLPPLFQARTAVLTVQAEQTNGYHVNKASVKLVAYYQNIWPEEPQTRRPGQEPEGQAGRMGGK